MREYFDTELHLIVDRDVNASINIHRVGLDVFPTIKRRKGNSVIVEPTTTNSTSKEVLTAQARASEAHTESVASVCSTSLE